ncbi:DNA polymerase III delta prime subunit [Geothermobacter ehrlichii]|uniref:DNA polymerase III subunit delta' n=1 Tax=Geothermobacter ehrlichii TaxID=213224 RepID=A0A5D3WNH9_9BACT|nr:DNA polymerase III subunit delta' [Geothermobacter ehrlichii]TYP00122.1 DNA polymerase III delta prime subunit [Geothermobacter ehrlichii]
MTFDQIIGHNRQKDILRRAIASGRLAHAYLFEGPEGVGKKLVALAVARAVYCHRKTGCGTCSACRKVDHNNHPDLHMVEPAGAGVKIDQIRELQRELAYRPLEGTKKICIIDQADTLNPAAGNALLKTLEEPPGEAMLILLASRPERLLTTIRSRCQRLPFRRLSREQIRDVLVDKLGLDETEAHIHAALSDGSFTRAFGRNREAFEALRREALQRLTSGNMTDALERLKLAEYLDARKDELDDILEIVQSFLRDVLHRRLGRPEEEIVNLDHLDEIDAMARRESLQGLLDKLTALVEARSQLERNINRHLAMNVLIQKLAA